MAVAANQVSALYQELLGRAPDAGGLANYQRYGNVNAVRNSILGSAEYKSRSAAPAAAAAPAVNPSQALFDFAAQQKAESQAILDRQKAEQQGLFGQYTQAIQGQEQLPALLQRLQQEAGIPEASAQLQTYKDQIYRVKDMLDRIDEDVTTRTRGTLTNEAQRRAMVADEGEDLTNQLGRLGTGMAPIADILTGAQGQVGSLLPLYMQQQAKDLQPLEMQINALGDRFAREISGFNENRETQFNAIMDKLERERYLSDREWQLARELEAEQREFQRQRSLAAQSARNYLQPVQQPASGGGNAPRQLPGLALNTMSNVGGIVGTKGSPRNPLLDLIKLTTMGYAR